MNYQITTFTGEKRLIKPRLELYSQKAFMNEDMPGIAIMIDDVTAGEHEAEPYCDLTTSFGEFIGMKNCAYIDTNNCDFADQLLQAGIAKDTGFYKASGFCTYPLWVFDEQFLRSCGEENYEKYSSRFDEYMKDTLNDHEYDDESEDEGEDESIGMNM